MFPNAEIQRCVIHMLRNSFKYVNYTDLKKFSSDFKAVYHAPTETAALSELENVKDKWGKASGSRSITTLPASLMMRRRSMSSTNLPVPAGHFPF